MLKNGLIAAAFAVLAVVAAVGWSRKAEPTPVTPAATNYAEPAYSSQTGTQPASATQPASYDAYGQPVSGAPAYGAPAAIATTVSNPCVDSYRNPVGYQQAVYGPGNGYVSDRYVESIHRPVVVRRTEYVERDRGSSGYSYADREVVRHPRSTKKSVAIVAGSAAGGAAIGALAGGGKGAGIGALAGGAGGFIYDRLTHNHH